MSAAETTQHGDEPAPEAGTEAAPEAGTEATPDAGAEATPDALASAVQELTDRIEALQADVRRLGGPGLPPSEPAGRARIPIRSHLPMRGSAPSPRRFGGAVPMPRLLLEVLFLAATATVAAIAELEAAAIAAVMIGAWVLVALIEWAASRADRRRDEIPGDHAAPDRRAARRPTRPGSCRPSSRP